MAEHALTPLERLALAFQVFFWILFRADVTAGALRLREAHRGAASRAGEATVDVRPTEPAPVARGSTGSPAAPGAPVPSPSAPASSAPAPSGAPPATKPAAVAEASPLTPARPAVVAPVQPAREKEPGHKPALQLLAALQREGRLVDFVEEDLTGFSDASIGAAARTVHAGCKRVLRELFDLEPVLREGEGATVTVAEGFDAAAIRLTGNVVGKPPFKGALRHHGWRARKVKLPTTPDGADPAVLAPAEVEL